MEPFVSFFVQKLEPMCYGVGLFVIFMIITKKKFPFTLSSPPARGGHFTEHRRKDDGLMVEFLKISQEHARLLAKIAESIEMLVKMEENEALYRQEGIKTQLEMALQLKHLFDQSA